eukprot:TRINITY_DN1077_c0_g1_i2.p4 TRINITY_DN1077_c0_g1~~TRINITY_DN1077_c0_g1_i2.p4  ORF type:complete len:55 (+),score=3.91 TRINITY_DN1077_c0_g1_i2:1039-1203(+)
MSRLISKLDIRILIHRETLIKAAIRRKLNRRIQNSKNIMLSIPIYFGKYAIFQL